MSNKKKRELESKILSILKKNKKKKYNYKQLSRILEIKNIKDKEKLVVALRKLNNLNKIIKIKEGQYRFKVEEKKYKYGALDITSSGNGYLLSSGEDIFISKKKLNKALHKDRVKVYVYERRDKNNKISGEVTEIIERAKHEYVGVVQNKKEFGFVQTRGPKMYTDVFLPPKEISKAKNGDKVVVKITDWPERAHSPFGKIIKALGKPGDADVEMDAILYDYDLPSSFGANIINDAEKIDNRILEEEINKRKDFRDVLTFTIDPVNAKDFDDAISFKKTKNNLIEVGIHIADVSHFLRENSELEKEAYKRATSVYLVDRVVPMLPEVLSNNLCSLRPNEEKLTFSAVFEIDIKGKIYSEWFGKTIINSDKRFSYEEAQLLIENKKTKIDKEVALEKKEYSVSEEILQAILGLNTIAKSLRNARMKKGALSFDKVEVGFSLNSKKEPTGIRLKESKDANKLVEEFMLLANKKVAEYIKRKKPAKSFIYRVHDRPDDDKIKNLKEIVSSFGYKLDTDNKNLNKSLNNLFLQIKGKPEQNMIDTLTIRSMSKAVYTTENIGHYGLAFDSYSHFTSPIRRYPDILTHRLLEKYITGGKSEDKEVLEEACIHSSYKEQISVKAERDSIKFMQIKYMKDKVGQRYNGVISGVTERGIYVEITENKCEGMISIKTIKGDHYLYDQNKHQLEGYSYGKTFKLGDPIEIVVKKADMLNKHLDFILENN